MSLSHRFVLVCASLTLIGCATVQGTSPTPVAPRAPFYVPGIERAEPSTAGARGGSPVPSDVGLTAGLRLPGASLNNRGSVRALVLPVAFGSHLPRWSDTSIAAQVLGSGRPGANHATAGRLADASQGLFRLDASVFPVLVDPETNPDDILAHDPTGTGLATMARRVLAEWARRVNLAAYDNDGPDGQPMSGDDDGHIDYVLLTLETELTPALVRLDLPVELPVGRGGRLTLIASPIYLLTLPRSGTLSPDNLGATAMTLRAMGLDLEEMFFPNTYARQISTVARARLGWVATTWAGRSGGYDVPDHQVLVVPIVDVDRRRGLWLVERDGPVAYLTRVARKDDGHFATVETRRMVPGADALTLALTSAKGVTGPRLELAWPSASEGLSATVTLTVRN
jgi:hypothetical protein